MAAGTTSIRVMADIPLEPALAALAADFARAEGIAVDLACAPSPEVEARIIGQGEAADLVIVQPEFLARLARAGRVAAGEGEPVGTVGVGLGNRPDAPAHDVSTSERLRQVLLGADLVVFNSVASGQVFARALEHLGIADVLQGRIRRTTPTGIFAPVLAGRGNEILAGTMTLIAEEPRIRLLGPLPGDLQAPLVYRALAMAGARQPAAAERFLRFLRSPEGQRRLRERGVL
ncbi:substrate-binding domain-containing protein [Paracraurococcus lichenis]|uniref:Substrate-binding domain-containing protein n=1 Tax=Paracraurococcus lichenis TaxID=3064888 RepID=A0ABT9DZJ8_9PROT|nr:substrate-binding domain-containing protein [Paracraurococcus sp. LOR1-02]MDO9709309.1 substrate-binding domain-containing protein [Paracraurococcus sp. LOR1-02]